MTDLERVVLALEELKPAIKPSADPAWAMPPALRVIDCLLSLNRNFDKFVVPRRDRFKAQHPLVKTVEDLDKEISRHRTPHAFMLQTLRTNFEQRAQTLAAVTHWLVSIGGTGTDADQLQRLEAWAATAHPHDHKTLGIRGFGLSGFQYLRMLFGADTTKPDLRIRQWVSKAIGRHVTFTKADSGHLVSDLRALALMEGATRALGLSLRDADATIWELLARGARREGPQKTCSSSSPRARHATRT
jgi:hypothetical protein